MILMNDFKQDHESLIQAELRATERVLRSGWWVLGNEVKSFEKQWAKYTGTQYAMGVGNGVDALEIGLRSLNISRGDEVITTAMTAFATVLSIFRAGAIPVLADIDANTGMLDAASVARCISPKTRAVMLVHLYGQAGDLGAISQLCNTNNIYLIEDAAQAHGAKYDGKSVGSFGIYSGWSFYPTKNLGAIGDAGAITTNDADLSEKVQQIRNYGQSIRYHHPQIGLNSRLDELQAALLQERLIYLPKWTERRREIAQIYTKAIQNDHIQLMPLPKDEERHVHHLFVIKCSAREKLQNYLLENEIQSLIHYPIPAHKQKPGENLDSDPQGLTITEQYAQEVLSIPCHPALTDSEVNKVIEVINEYQ